MARYLKTWKEHQLGEYPCKIFSADNWDEFDNYLDSMESEMPSDMQDELEWFIKWRESQYS